MFVRFYVAILVTLNFLIFNIAQASPQIAYQVHVSGYGWLDWVGNGSLAGTTGQGRPMEAIKIQVKGQSYDVYYRVHVANYGWLNWVKNGAIAGTTGQSRPIEAIQIKLGYK